MDIITLNQLLESKRYKAIKNQLNDINSVDIADMLDQLTSKSQLIVFRLMSKDIAADVFSYMSQDSTRTLIDSLTNKELGILIDDLYSDDVVDLLDELPANVVKRVLASSSSDTRREINHLLRYPDYSAGSHMNVEFVDLKIDMTINQAIERIRNVGVDKETINTCYVMDSARRLLGVITIRRLLLAKGTQLVGELMKDNVITVFTHDDQEHVAHQFQKYDLTIMPVVDNEKRLVGIITVDDVVDIMQEETTEDIEKMAAIVPGDKPYIKTGVIETYKKRIPWLLLLMVSASITAQIITHFESALSGAVILTAFIPMLMDTGGNCGSQASVSVIRALSLKEIKYSDTIKIVFKELRVSFLIGGSLSIANFIKLIFIDNISIQIACVICLTLWITVIIAKLVGCMLPIGASKIGFDPAIMASPFITTIVDALSLMVYFTLATNWLNL